MIRLTLVPYVLVRDSDSEEVVVRPSPSFSSNYFNYNSETSNSFDLLDFDNDNRVVFLDSRCDGDLAYCYLVMADNGFYGIVRPYLVDDLAFGLVGSYYDLASYVWDYNFKDK